MSVKHKWHFDLPWHFVKLIDWFYMVNYGAIGYVLFLHTRILGVCSTWEMQLPNHIYEVDGFLENTMKKWIKENEDA